MRHGIKFSDPAHNIYGIEESTRVAIKTKTTKIKVNGRVVIKTEEVARYDHVYDSTAARGGTIFWKNSDDYVRITGAKEYK